MPPRFAYWTILIDNAPTAFRARDREDLLPTLHQLKRTNADVVMKWFARGRLWESMEQEHEDFQQIKIREKRGRDWRPGGDHKDPRARFDKSQRKHQAPRARHPHQARGTSTQHPAPSTSTSTSTSTQHPAPSTRHPKRSPKRSPRRPKRRPS